MKTALSALIISCFLTGCTTITITPPTIQQQAVLVKNSAKITTIMAIKSIWSDPIEQAKNAKEMADFAGKVVYSTNSSIGLNTVNTFIDMFYSGDNGLYIKAAVDTLSEFISIKTTQPTENQRALIISFFLGVKEGCEVYRGDTRS